MFFLFILVQLSGRRFVPGFAGKESHARRAEVVEIRSVLLCMYSGWLRVLHPMGAVQDK